MDKPIVAKNFADYQLISIGIELVHKLICFADCSPELLSGNTLLSKACKLAIQWNETFFDLYVPSSPEKMEDSLNG